MTSRYLKPLKSELGPYLTNGVAPLVGALFECEFEFAGDLERIAEQLKVMPDITWSWEEKSGSRCLLGTSKGRQITFEIFAGQGGWRLDMRMREMGRSWGSNEAYYNRFRAEAFALLKVTSATHLRPTFRRKL